MNSIYEAIKSELTSYEESLEVLQELEFIFEDDFTL